jgi:hypothetical protein
LTVQSFKASGRRASRAGADRIVVFTPESSNSGPPPGKWEHAEIDGAILLYRDDPSELIMVVMDEELLLKSRRNRGKSPKKGL